MKNEVTLTADEVAELRTMAQRILALLPDPERVVHACVARNLSTPKVTLCGRGGRTPRNTEVASLVTCQACLNNPDWMAWEQRAADFLPEGVEPPTEPLDQDRMNRLSDKLAEELADLEGVEPRTPRNLPEQRAMCLRPLGRPWNYLCDQPPGHEGACRSSLFGCGGDHGE